MDIPRRRGLGFIPTIRETPYYLGAPALQPSGQILTVTGSGSGVPPAETGAEQDTGSVDPVAELSKSWMERNLSTIAILGISSGGMLALWLLLRNRS